MPLIIGLGFAAFAISYFGIGAYKRWATRRRILDIPNKRSAHSSPIPRGGGITLAIVILLGQWLAFATSGSPQGISALVPFTLGGIIIAAIGWLDDLYSIPRWLRFAGHCMAATAAITGMGYWNIINIPIAGQVELQWAGLGITFFWLIGLINGYNFMDGADGLAGSQGFIAGAAWALLGWLSGQPMIAASGALIAGSCLGFLGHNWPPASIFLGDAGSTFLGFSFAAIPLFYRALEPPAEQGSELIIAILFLWPFIFDTALTLLRRFFRGENILEAHRSHLYQRLALSGWKPEAVILLYSSLALLGVLAARVWSKDAAGGEIPGLFLLPILGFVLWGIVKLQERSAVAPQPILQAHMLRFRIPMIIMVEVGLLSLAYYASFALRLDFDLDEPYASVFLATLPLVLLIKLAVFYYFGLLRGWWRYVGLSDLMDIFKAVLISAPLVYLSIHLTRGLIAFPRSVFIIDPILTVIILGGARFLVRVYSENVRFHDSRVNTLIIGAGHAGRAIARELGTNPRASYLPVGFIDDDRTKWGIKVEGIKVLAGTDRLPEIIDGNNISHVLIAIPSATGWKIQKIIDSCGERRVDIKILPAISEVLNGRTAVGQLRRVRLEDLLARKPVVLDLGSIRSRIEGKNILITGAGGSIGAELARQIVSYNPDRLVLYERSETDLFNIQQELCQRAGGPVCNAVIGDILDVRRLHQTIFACKPHSIFHAAAFKHVPMMEENCFEAVVNNVFGTYNVSRAAADAEVEDFVLISTDKAVYPVNIMGVTKRLAELLLLDLRKSSTRFVSVRFGNVLGSRGSAITIFEKQIAERKPITVTHPEATRYFMTIQEAVQLVLQASVMGNGGEIFVLDMGEPVRIANLARELILLSGLQPHTEIPIIYTGLRPGEKLNEELHHQHEGTKQTSHEKIRVLNGGEVSPKEVQGWMADLFALVEAKDLPGLIAKLQAIVPEYSPSEHILSRISRSDSTPIA